MTYIELVEKAKKEISNRPNYGNEYFTFEECKTWINSDQINLYAYWQGYQIENKESGIDILLVAQDWGHNPDYDKEYLTYIAKIKNGLKVDPAKETQNHTNAVLGDMFAYLGIDVYKYNCSKKVFFTNYSLGYRPLNVSESGLMTRDLLEQDKKFFELLVEILKPKCIICLGQLVYEIVSNESTKNIWVKHLKEFNTPFIANYPIDFSIKVYGVPHCGWKGVSNVGGKNNVIKIWKNMANDINTRLWNEQK